MTDQDGDGYGDNAPATGVTPGTDCDDTDPLLETSDDDLDGYSTCTGDCDDEDSYLNLLDNDGDGFSTVLEIATTQTPLEQPLMETVMVQQSAI